ncbi:MAG: AMP-binding protein, partial [Acidimicrobiales bacterium]|nr:AMP-binding protein [Acidimicrobiales bacterium]
MTSHLTLGRWIIDRARTTPDRVAIDFLDHHLTYAELNDRSSRLAAELVQRGLSRGDRVAVLADNCPEYVSVFFACARVGLVMTPLNWRLTAVELAYQLDHSGSALLVVSADRMPQAHRAVEAASIQPSLRLIEEPATAVDNLADDVVVVVDDDPLMLIYTSGTTGRPKGAVLSHANCFWTNTSIDRLMDVCTFDVVLQVLPQFHVGGWNVQPLLAWWKGATVVLEPEFDAGR